MMELYYRLKAEVDAGPSMEYSPIWVWKSWKLAQMRSYLTVWKCR